MADVNYDVLKKRMEALKEASEKQEKGAEGSNRFVKFTTPGRHTVRILPNPNNDGSSPFTEVFNYFGLNVTFLQTTSNPISDYYIKVRASNTDSSGKWIGWNELDKNVRNFLGPISDYKKNARVFMPVLVRGQEEEGVKILGLSGNIKPGSIYLSLLEAAANVEENGHIFDYKEGTDIDIIITAKEIDGQERMVPTSIQLKRKSSPVSTDKNVISLIKNNFPDMEKELNLLSYEQIKDALEKYVSKFEVDISMDSSVKNEVVRESPKKATYEVNGEDDPFKTYSEDLDDIFGKITNEADDSKVFDDLDDLLS